MNKERNIQATNPRVIQAVEMYKAGKAAKTICKELRMDWATLKKFLEYYGVRRTANEAIRRGKSGGALVKHDALDVLTPEALYWIGFLYADGHIEKSRPRILLTVTEEDMSHLEKFANFFGEGLSIIQTGKGGLGKNGYVNSASYRVAFSSPRVYQKLLDLGFTNRKTWDITPHDLLKNSRDFWRGVVDGDGWITSSCDKRGYTTNVVGLCGHVNSLNAFVGYCENSGIKIPTVPRKDKRREFLWKIDFRGAYSKDVATLLYKDAPVYLNRKYEKYLSWINPDNSNNNTPLGVFHTSSEENCTALSDQKEGA